MTTGVVSTVDFLLLKQGCMLRCSVGVFVILTEQMLLFCDFGMRVYIIFQTLARLLPQLLVSFIPLLRYKSCSVLLKYIFEERNSLFLNK